jgi:hypothetical protein
MEGLTSTFTGLLAEAGTDFQGELVDKFYPPLGQCLARFHLIFVP